MPASVLFLFVLCQVIKALFTEHDKPTIFGLPPKCADHMNEAGNYDLDAESNPFSVMNLWTKNVFSYF